MVTEPSYRGSSVDVVPRGNPSPKLAITVAPDVYDALLDAAADDGVSVSAWITDVVRDALAIRRGLAAIAAWEAEHGAFTEEELAEADRRVDAMLEETRRLREEHP